MIAYSLRMYAVMEAMKIDKNSTEANQFISDLMTQMEALKSSPKYDESLDEEAKKAKIEQMALNVFANADKQDRAGAANKRTAAAFNTSFVLMDVLKQFGERDYEIEVKAKYALW